MMKLSDLKGVGPKTVKQLAELGIYDISDILFHLPLRYQDRTRIVPIHSLRPGDQAVIEGKITRAQVKFAGKRQLQLTLADRNGEIQLKFFHFNKAQQHNLRIGTRLRCFGEVKYWQRQLMMIHPEYRRLGEQTILHVEENLTPIYPTTDGLQQNTWRALTQQALAYLQTDGVLEELVPREIRQQFDLADIKTALLYVHRPPADTQQALLEQGMHSMQQALAFEELLAHQLGLRQLRVKLQQHSAYPLRVNTMLCDQFIKTLAFSLTAAQAGVVSDIQDDLTLNKPMMRLLQGDVGSGKTVVAAIAALQAIANQHQAAIMAPTELLAEQHYRQFKQWFVPLGIKVAWLSGKLKIAERRNMLAQLHTGEAQLIVGTHALFQPQVVFHDLALVIVDEQHRFGVAQRSALREKGEQLQLFPHQLIMTATPIPRTLAMTVYADLDTSVIDELPPGRTPIKTAAINNTRRIEVIDKVKQLCQQGGQVYWVCPLIEVSELLDCEAAEKTAQALQQSLPKLRVALLHGRLKSEEKQQIMQQFQAGNIDLLVATTVIEVGIDVPNATLMVIENPERMGLAQLHQLRGRVGRGAKESHCILLYRSPLSANARKRLSVMRESMDGFYIAQQDLELRGPGEVMGTKQTGLQRLRIANIMRDRHLLPKVQQAANMILQQHIDIIPQLKRRWIGTKEQFAKV